MCAFLDDSILEQLIKEGNEEQKNAAINNLKLSAMFRTARTALARQPRMIISLGAQTAFNRTIHTMNNSCNMWDLPGEIVLREGEDETRHDEDIKKCYGFSKNVYDFFKENYGRISADDNGYPLNLSVHYCGNYDNAFWQGQSWAFGDGGGGFFNPGRMTDESVVYHEYVHGVTQFTSNFSYEKEAGGLNESISDVFSAMCEQRVHNQNFEQASWLIGKDMIVGSIGKALRSLEDPGNQSKTHRFDRQVANFNDYRDDMDPHVSSAIPNKAFYLVCKALGGNSWDKAGKIWYKALLANNPKPFCTFKEFASDTLLWANTLYGADVKNVVENAWNGVGIQPEAITLETAFRINQKYR
jgi:Zn-dependent metalloprotease